MKNLKLIGAFALSLAMVPMFSSCGDDDAPDKPISAAVSNIDGTHVTRVGNCRIEYDEKGRPVSFSDNYGVELEIDYSKNLITGDDYDMKVKFNNKGFITELSASWDEVEDDYGDQVRYQGNGKYIISYKDDRISTIKGSSSETVTDLDSKETSKYSGELTDTYVWNKGMLTKIKHRLDEKEDGEKWSENADTEVEYGTEVNEYLQFPLSIIHNSEILYPEMYIVGLFGNGPSLLPSKVSVEEDDYSTSANVDFDLNANGSIKKETAGRWGFWVYSYEEFTRGQEFATDDAKPLKPLRKIFPHHKAKR